MSGPSYYWVDWEDKGIRPPPPPPTPKNAVLGGKDIDGCPIYVGRALHEGVWMTAKALPDRKIAYVGYNGEEHAKPKFQILCEQRFEWVPCENGEVPPGAVEGERTSDGEILYIGRVAHENAQTVGKIHPSHGCLYIPFRCVEKSFKKYEALVLIQ